MILGQWRQTPLELSADYVIVGSGASGASAARVLTDTNASVVIVEEGPSVATAQFGDTVWPAFHGMLRDMGGQIARGRAFMPVLQGRCLGGSTVINSAIMWRVPDDVFVEWEQRFGLGHALPAAALHAHWDTIERELGVGPTSDAALGHNAYMRRATDALGIVAHPTRRGASACQGSARCLTGCPHGAKQSMLVSYLPYAQARGAQIVTGATVERVQLRGGRAVSVRGRLGGSPHTASFVVHARKAVLLGASAIQTPGILRRSGVRHRHLGRHFLAHPGSPLMGLFDESVHPWTGATQGFDAEGFRKQRFKIETISMPPELAFVRLPGTGRRWVESMQRAAHVLVWGVQLRAEAEGRVRHLGPLKDITYEPTPKDMQRLRGALKACAEMFFAAGAREVIVPIHGMPERLRSVDEIAVFDQAPSNPAAYSWILSHLFGTARMSNDPRDGVVGPDFRVHGTDNLYVVDSSLFPTNLGVNPQMAIQGVAMHAATELLQQYEG